MRVPPQPLRRLVGRILERGGSAAAEADLVAGHLVDANLAGHDSHGVGLIPHYVGHLESGLVVPNTPVKTTKDYVKASPPADPAALVLVPGDPERMHREERMGAGIPIDSVTWEEIPAAGEKLGLARSEAMALVA